MKSLPVAAFLVLTLLLQTAAAQDVYRDFDATTSLATYKTYTVAVEQRRTSSSPQEAELSRLAVAAVESQLLKHQLKRQSAASADLLVVCYAFVKDRRTPIALDYKEEELSINSELRRWQLAGNIVVDLIDGKSRSLVWRGVAIQALSKPQQFEQQITKAVARLFKNYPASRRGMEMGEERRRRLRRLRLYGVLFAVGVVFVSRLIIAKGQN